MGVKSGGETHSKSGAPFGAPVLSYSLCCFMKFAASRFACSGRFCASAPVRTSEAVTEVVGQHFLILRTVPDAPLPR